MKPIVILAALALAACAREAGPSSGDSGVSPSPAPSAAAQTSALIGEFVVIAVDGAEPTINIAGYDPLVTIGPERIHFQSQCIYSDWTYSEAGDGYSATPYYEPGSAMCARALAPGEGAIQAAFDELRDITVSAGGGLIVEGGGHRLELQRRADPPTKAAFAGDLTGEWRVAGLDGAEIDKSYGIALSGNRERIWWGPACALQFREYTIDGNRFSAAREDLSDRAVCEIGYPQEVPLIWRALDAADTIERTAANGVLISGGGRSVTLFSQ